MSKVARIIGTVAAIVAIAASIAITLGATAFLGVALTTIAAAAGAVSSIAMAVAQATQKPPDFRGSVSSVVIGANLPVPLMLGLTFAGGVLVYDKAGPPADNKNRTQIMVVSAAGPIESFEKIYADFSPITFASESGAMISGVASGYYGADGGYLWANSRLGLRPDTALTPAAGRPAWRNWDSTYKLSGLACYSLTAEFDEDGERFASGMPQWGVLAKGIKFYDPRLDSTYPGGSGGHRWDDESSWAWSANPAIQYLGYARGWFQDGKKIAGCGLPQDSIWIDQIVEWANACAANDWASGGTIWDGSGINRWDNLKRIAQAGGAEPVWTGGKLGVSFAAPKVPVFTITADDLAAGEVSVQAMQGFRDRVNTVVARVRSADHRWEYVQLGEVTGSTYLTEDGETKTREVQFDLVQDSNQGAQLAALVVADSRELGPITLPLKPRFMLFRPGEAGIVDLPEAGLVEQLCVITARSVDPANATVTLTLRSETTAKHDWALTQTGTVPATPTLFGPDEMDETIGGAIAVPSTPTSITVQEWTNRILVTTDPLATAKTYRWRFYLSDGTTLKREIITTIPQVEYTSAQAHYDGISRSYKIEVAGINAVGTGTAYMSATQTNAAPSAPTSVAFADGTSTSTVTFTEPGDTDRAGYLVAYSTISGFDPMTEGSAFAAGGSPAYTPQLPAATYYGKVATYDLWSSRPSLLNFSAEDTFVITPGSGGSPAPGGGGGGEAGGGNTYVGGGGIHEP